MIIVLKQKEKREKTMLKFLPLISVQKQNEKGIARGFFSNQEVGFFQQNILLIHLIRNYKNKKRNMVFFKFNSLMFVLLLYIV